MKKRLLSLVMVIVMVFSLLPSMASAVINSGSCGDNVSWEYNSSNSVLTISGYGEIDSYETFKYPWNGMGIKNVIIQEGITNIPHSAFYYSTLSSVSIPSTVKTIGSSAFGYCSKLENISITDTASLPSQLETIGSYSFTGCSSLKSFFVPKSVTLIDDRPFTQCYILESFNVDTANTEYCSVNGVLFNKSRTVLIRYPEGKEDSSYSVPTSVNEIYNFAFVGNHYITNIVFPQSVTTIGQSAMQGCRSLVSASMIGVERIRDGVFRDLTNLQTVTLSNKLQIVWVYAFSGCSNLSDVYFYGTENEWNSIDTSTDNEPLVNANIHILNHLVTFDANGGSVDTNSKTVTNGSTYGSLPTPTRNGYVFDGWYTAVSGGNRITSSSTVNLSSDQTLYAHWNVEGYTIYFDANGGSVSPSSKTVTNGSAYGTLPTPTRSGYSFDGWFTSASGGTQVTSSTIVNLSASQTLYAHWTHVDGYTVSYDANGGTGTPSSQTKEKGVPLTLSSITPSKSYVLRYNANGGSVTPASKSVNCTFKNWNTDKNGLGSSYPAGGSYQANENVTLYAQWSNPTAGALATPSRSGYDFAGWFTSATGGSQINDSSTISENMTLYAHWTQSVNPYNLGDETYSFSNYGDSDSPYGHCFGMSITSAGYYNNLLDISRIGGNADTPLYSFSRTAAVKQPICYYQSIQGSYSARAIVAGGSTYLTGKSDIASDWQEVVSYVSNHNYDGKGLLQIGFRKNNVGGHAINFLRYENVNGQDRIYAYDNNFPDQETYFYQDSNGRVWQAPVQTFSGSIDCIALRDCRVYFSSVGDFDATHVLYMPEDAAIVLGYSYSYLEGFNSDEEYVVYEIPTDQDRVIIVPKRDNADFIYMDTEYSFGEISDQTRGELKFATLKEGAMSTEASFHIFEDDAAPVLKVVQHGTTLQYEIENFNSEKMVLLAADYDDSGKMLGMKQVSPSSQTGEISVNAAASHRVFLVDRNGFKPLCTAWTSS